MKLDCFTNLIGITDKDCECYDASGKAYNVTESTTGYYLTDQLDINIAALSDDCDSATDMFDQMNGAIERGAKEMLAELTHELRAKRMRNPSGARQDIGTRSNPNINETAATYNGVRWQCIGREGVYAYIRQVEIRVKTSSTSNKLSIFNNRGDIIKSVSFNASTGLNTIDVGVWLPLWSTEDTRLDYYIVHNADQPNHNKADCGCGGARSMYKKYIHTNGVQSSSSPTDPDGYSTTSSAWGTVVIADFDCPVEKALCDLATEDVKDVLGATWVSKAAMVLAEQLIHRNQIDQYSLLSMELLTAKLDQLEEEYNKGIKWLAEHATYPACMPCKAGSQRKGILL
jgi:hypothetical protein